MRKGKKDEIEKRSEKNEEKEVKKTMTDIQMLVHVPTPRRRLARTAR